MTGGGVPIGSVGLRRTPAGLKEAAGRKKRSFQPASASLRTEHGLGRTTGFTLIEVILAISIAIGILVVALYFYGQATDLRARLLEESDRIASIRLCLDRLTADLRQAFPQPQIGFTGTDSSMRFAVAGLPTRPSPTRADWTQSLRLESDLRVITYTAAQAIEGTNVVVTGITRVEVPLLDKPPAMASTNSSWSRSPPSSHPAPVTSTPAAAPWIEAVHFVQLAYWDGSGWSDHWDSPALPAAVEIGLGVEALPEGTDPLDYPYELFRRVICLPGSRGANDPLDLFASRTTPRLASTQ